jgi:hypothetical protein
MAYRVLGSRADKDRQSALFDISDWVKKKRSAGWKDDGTGGRKEQRKH